MKLPALAFLVAAGLALASGRGYCGKSGTEAPRILLHAVPSSSKNLCSPGVGACAEANIQAEISTISQFMYYAYLLVIDKDPGTGVQEIHTGLSYDTTTLSGVDIFNWNLCADGEAPSAGWYQEGGDNRITWNSPGTGEVAVAGYFYITGYNNGAIALVPPQNGRATVTPFSGPADSLDVSDLGFIGFGDEEGCNPCLTTCDFTPVRPSTWSSLKLLSKP
jgi:hypothetical protein